MTTVELLNIHWDSFWWLMFWGFIFFSPSLVKITTFK